MLIRHLLKSAPIFLFFYLIQESVVSQFHLLGGGISIFLLFALVWSVLSTPEVAAATGFAAGVMMDLSQSSSGPVGQWALIMITICYAISFLGYGDESIHGSPAGIVFLVVAGCVASEILFLVSAALLGISTGNAWHLFFTILGSAMWAVIFTPIFLPLFSYLRSNAMDTRSSL